jgi:hypothetical protein
VSSNNVERKLATVKTTRHAGDHYDRDLRQEMTGAAAVIQVAPTSTRSVSGKGCAVADCPRRRVHRNQGVDQRLPASSPSGRLFSCPLPGPVASSQNVFVSRGPTRRTRRLLKQGALDGSEMSDASHEADLSGHPYVAPEHFHLAKLRREGRLGDYQELRASIRPVAAGRWRKPLGPKSALRPLGRSQTQMAQEAARDQDDATVILPPEGRLKPPRR